MSDEIKEILENVKKCCEIMKDNNFVVYQKQDILKLLDYITNLQEERNDYKSRNDKAIDKLNTQLAFTSSYQLNYQSAINIIEETKSILQGVDKE